MSARNHSSSLRRGKEWATGTAGRLQVEQGKSRQLFIFTPRRSAWRLRRCRGLQCYRILIKSDAKQHIPYSLPSFTRIPMDSSAVRLGTERLPVPRPTPDLRDGDAAQLVHHQHALHQPPHRRRAPLRRLVAARGTRHENVCWVRDTKATVWAGVHTKH